MGSEVLSVRNSGIYHNLPQFDPFIKDLTAIITGANGISGFQTLRALLDSPQRWAKIYAISRRPPPPAMMSLLSEEQQSRVQHVASDFLKPAAEVAEALRAGGVSKVDYVFFYSYLQPPPPKGSAPWSNVEELTKVNTALLKNFIEALPIAGLKPKRFSLQTGAKNYGIHLGRGRTPHIESDPQPSHLALNFYYPQEKILFDYCSANPSTTWNIIMPAWIIGATNNAQMNALHPFSVYAAVRSHLSQPLTFPGSWASWQAINYHSCARLTGYLAEWAALEPKCANQRFNSTDTAPMSFDRFFERLATWFDVKKGVVPPPDDEGADTMITIPAPGGKDSPMGYGPTVESKFTFTLSSWAADSQNHDAWKEIMKASNGKITHDPFEDIEANFAFGDGALLSASMCLSMNKARRLGWTGYVDTIEGIFEMYKEMGATHGTGMVSDMVVDEAEPLV